MAIGFLQQDAFRRVPDFQAQVDGVVRTQVHGQFGLLDPELASTPAAREKLMQILDNPDRWPFVKAILSDAGWIVTYDAWAMDPAGKEGDVLAGVVASWLLVTGLPYLQAPAP